MIKATEMVSRRGAFSLLGLAAALGALAVTTPALITEAEAQTAEQSAVHAGRIAYS
jgi:hypothetical protein